MRHLSLHDEGAVRTGRLLAAILIAAVLPIVGCGGDDAAITVSPTEYDFGRVMQGETREHTFTLSNHGNRTTAFTVQPNCGCFAVSRNLRPIDPGEDLEFKVIFHTKKHDGPIRGKWITIHTDHPEVPKIVLPLSGEIYRTFDLRPATLYLGEIDGRDENYEPRTVVVRPESDYRLKFVGFFATPQVVDVTATPAEDGSLSIQLRLRKDVRRPKGPFIAQVRLDLEVRSPEGVVKRNQAIVNVRGVWTL